ncbi:hypothetical protein SAMN02982918_3825 [Saccharomonospora viridis]|jgi:hypothetical protein|nr:hypothetical protein SAMN02982918_3825 [Saccharomonospora viridis]
MILPRRKAQASRARIGRRITGRGCRHPKFDLNVDLLPGPDGRRMPHFLERSQHLTADPPSPDTCRQPRQATEDRADGQHAQQ